MPGKKADAEAFASRWANKGNENQDTQRFWIDFYQNVLGVEDAVSRLEFEKPVSTDASTHDGYIDVFIPSAKTLVEQKSLGIDLAKEETRQGRKVTPAKQGNAYAQGMPLSQQPRYIIACNFSDFWVFDRERDSLCREPLFKLPLAELPKNLAAIQFLKGGAEAPATISRAVSVEAGKIMSKLHEQVAEAFDDPDTPENHHALSVLMTRLMFLMFCEDSGLIAPNAFRDYVSHFSADDLRHGLKDLFVWLDTKDEKRDKYAGSWLKKLPYMNGGLFREKTEIPPLSENFRHTLIVEGCQEFDWSGVSPTVFGSIFEGALSHDHRRANGQHFTSPENIHKVIDPLFLDGLKAEFDGACAKPVAGGARTRALKELHEKIGGISILDPAAGSGNFLTESYLCLRQLENRILFELQGEQTSFSFEDSGDRDVLVSLKNFHGIELEDFACCVARTALWIAEKQADTDTAKVTQRVYQELPLTDYEGIVNANALRIDWNDVVSADEVDYVLGNPPFIGSSRLEDAQKEDRKAIFGNPLVCSTMLHAGIRKRLNIWMGIVFDVHSFQLTLSVRDSRLSPCGSPCSTMAFISISPIKRSFGIPKHLIKRMSMLSLSDFLKVPICNLYCLAQRVQQKRTTSTATSRMLRTSFSKSEGSPSALFRRCREVAALVIGDF
ncbi:MAG: DNA methyltransferase [Collinsella sp.]|nr:DNA methyltransferase [Collinsella sp.]